MPFKWHYFIFYSIGLYRKWRIMCTVWGCGCWRYQWRGMLIPDSKVMFVDATNIIYFSANTEWYLSCACSIWAAKLHWLDKYLLYTITDWRIRLFEICFHFAGLMSSTQEFSAGPSEFLPDLHFLCKIVLKPSNVIPLLLHCILV